MSWRGSTTVSDRIFASLPYLLPMVEVVTFGFFLLDQFPPLAVVFAPILILWSFYRSVRYAGLIIFFALLLLVVRNEKISHFIRFNTMQAILLDIIIFLFNILMDVVRLIPSGGFAIQTLSTTIFLGIVVAVGYSVIQSLSGRYAEIPAISDAVYMQVR
ncbi:MAG: Tic20 family protein [Nostoc sp.]|uniref:Tic20 family protein n=1 Tax=Nostoc sp. TaxID=1180 RepID=UPI002FFAF478